jgi:nucleotide-binding universal stress UspA family protein
MIRDLVVPITSTAGDANAVSVAVALATQFGAHLSVIEFVNLPTLPTGPWGTGEIGLGEIYNQFREDANKDAAAMRERLSKEAMSLSSEVRVVESIVENSPRLAALHARYGDLVVLAMANGQPRDTFIVRDFFASLLLDSGRPILLVPPGFAWRPIRHVVVAWQSSREATRALHDAMPFLHAATSIDLVEVDPDEDGALNGADIAAHLARHGLKVEVVIRPCKAGSIAQTLVDPAQETRADLIVAGGYGHSRLREWVMGGVTRDLLSGTCPLPILFSH